MSDEINYLDFEISVRKAGENEFIVRAESGDGEAETRFTSPFNEDKRALIAATLTKVALRSSAKVRSSSAPEVRKMKEVGATLFEHAITGPVREFYYKCQGQADQQSKGIRWRLSLDSSVDDLPWEFMYLQGEFLALNPRSPVVRYIKGAARVAPLKAEHPLRLLVVIASPNDETPLDTSAEKERIAAALRPLTAQGMIEVTYLEGPDTWERLLEALLPNRTHILHFIGHGAFDEDMGEGVLVMEDADRRAMRIDSERLRYLVQGKSRLRLVVLNSCLGTEGSDAQPFSSMAAGLVRSGIPAVIAMQFEISDNAARKIAQTFYTSLALNLPVDAALTEARRKIFLSDRDSLEWATPILYMQVPNGQLFEFDLETGPKPPEDTNPSPPTTDEVLAVLIPSDAGEEIRLGEKLIKVGRSPDSDVVLSESTVSRKQATLTRTGSTYRIENVGGSGTFVNGKVVTRSKTLKDRDVIRFGTVEFEFRSVAELVRAPNANPPERREMGPKDSLGDQAERCYQDGERAMEIGEWANAVKGFRSAVVFMPNYRDAAQKLSLCENCEKAAKQYDQAQRLCGEKKYYQALQALTSASKLDPSLIDTAGIREIAECGQIYGRAIGELQLGNRDKGGELLRDVINCNPAFEDADQRLKNLAEGGDGLLGTSLIPYRPTAAPPPPPNSGFEYRLYEIADPDMKLLAESVRQLFFTKGLTSQLIQQGAICVVQGKKDGWTTYLGMGLAATVMIEPVGANLKISIGGGKWLEQGAAMAAGLWLVVPLFTGAVGMAQQKQLMVDLWRMSENFVVTHGGRRIQ
ncbi:MAG TPA: CHAT domain-containing protein [Pyrinomonadaceae bacterium]|nr:CHAT domain-containing protein [Pyrinomonadaceae bacterium]